MVIWTEPAKNDLKNIYNYIAYDSEYYAKQVIGDILSKVSYLKDNPMIGKMVEEVNDSTVRQIFSYDYRIIYQNIQENCFILTILRSRQNINLNTVTL